MTMISVIIPAYNAEKYLPCCLDSVINQSFEDFEVIVVDDGSTDSTWSICEKYMKMDCRIRAVHQDNMGSVNARKNALMLSQGDYVTSVDADDWIHKDRLRGFASLVSEKKPDMLIAAFTNEEDGKLSEYRQYLPTGFYSRIDMEKTVFPNMLATGQHFTFGIMPSLCCCCIRREIMIKNYIDVPNDLSLGDDACITYPCILDADSLYISNDCGYYYRTNGNSMTHSWNPRIFSQCQKLFSYLETVKKRKKWDADGQIVEYKAFITWFIVRKALTADGDDFVNVCRELNAYLQKNHIIETLISLKHKKMAPKRRLIYWLIKNRCWKVLATMLRR